MKITKEKINIFWFRRDLRLEDNNALLHCLKSEDKTLPIFIFDKNILEKLDRDDARLSFIHSSLKKLKNDLIKIGSDIEFFHSTPEEAFQNLIKKYNIVNVFSNEDYEPYAISRDQKIKQYLTSHSIKFHQYKDHCIFSKTDILKADGNPYTVYTPYKNKWLATLSPKDLGSFHSKKYTINLIKNLSFNLPTLEELGFQETSIQFPKRIIKSSIIESYDQYRDIPALDRTSHLGIHLRFGTISIRKCVQIAYQKNATWLSELIWREFFIQILFHFPQSQNKAFKEKYRKIKWKNNKNHFNKWCQGLTGFPLVDAGMRELNQTGHMHNRVRMLTASFLVKDLLIDWRWGEKYFASKLLDFESASNVGNWQWAAGTGCDAAPYFRIFNPTTQLKKFDPDLEYIKKWIPEFGTDQYPKEIIDHNMAYHRAISTYKESIS